MKNENKCFFSISLENGITLTGNYAGSVREMLYQMHSAFYELGVHYSKNGLNTLAKHAFELTMQVNDAIETINRNFYDEE